jgi:hypothetical protein
MRQLRRPLMCQRPWRGCRHSRRPMETGNVLLRIRERSEQSRELYGGFQRMRIKEHLLPESSFRKTRLSLLVSKRLRSPTLNDPDRKRATSLHDLDSVATSEQSKRRGRPTINESRITPENKCRPPTAPTRTFTRLRISDFLRSCGNGHACARAQI